MSTSTIASTTAAPLRTSRIRLDPRTRAIVLLAGATCLVPLLLQLHAQLAIGIAVAGIAVALGSWRRPAASWVRVVLALALATAVFAVMGVNFGRDTGCAILAAMLAVKPAETDSLRDARSLLGFALFAPFATFLLDQGPLSLTLGLVAVVFVLLAMQRLSDLESGEMRDATSSWKRLASVGRMLALGLPIALAAFWLFPRLSTPLWGVPDRALARPGLADSMTPGRWEDMLFDDTPAARVRFFGATPPRDAMYFRGPVFSDYDGRTWSRGRWSTAYAPAHVQPTRVRWNYELALEPTDRFQLIALDVPLAAPARTTLGEDRTLRVSRRLDAVTRWRMQSGPVARFGDALPPYVRASNLQLPEGFNPRTIALAQQWRQDAGADDAAIVQRTLAWIRRDFGYTLEASLAGRDAVDQFLFVDKRGYCEQFSSSFVVLMRAAGIPARVVGGYAGADFNPIGEYWIVRRSDAHAWAEVWLDRRGWVRVDPTAAVAPERVFDTLQDRAAAGDLLETTLQPMRNVSDWMLNGWNDFVLGFNAERQRALFRPVGLPDLDSETLLLLFSLVALLCLAATVWLLSRDMRERDPVLRAWRRLARRYDSLGLARAPHEPALDWTQRVHAARTGGDAALQALGMRFTLWRYGAQPVEGLNALLRDLKAHRP
jgi:transglutaminase-like putative cysteine protease